MSLRYRLIVWIIATFIVAVIVDFSLEGYTTRKQVRIAHDKIKEKIIVMGEERRKHVEQYLAESISETQALIDVLLNRLTNFYLQVIHFAPTQENLDKGTWMSAASAIVSNKWVDFIQNTNQGHLASSLVPRKAFIDNTYHIPFTDDLAWVIMGDNLQEQIPMLGIRLPVESNPQHTLSGDEKIVLHRAISPSGYILFNLEDLAQNQTSPPPASKTNIAVPWSEGYEISLNTFHQSFVNACQYVSQNGGKIPAEQKQKIQEWIAQNKGKPGEILSSIRIAPSSSSLLSSKVMQEQLDALTTHYVEIYMAWTIASLFQTGTFGNDLFHPPSPRGISFYQAGADTGIGIHTDDVFYSETFFDDQAYFSNNHTPNDPSNVVNNIAVFRGPQNHVYIGNTAQLVVETQGAQKTGYLSLAVDGDVTLQRLVEAMGQAAMLVYNNEVFGMYTSHRQLVDPKDKESLPLAEMLAAPTGLINWKGTEYFFSKMTPFEMVDLHFITLNPASIEFAFLKYLVDGATHIADAILFNIHLIGLGVLFLVLILLHRIAGRITKPITQLAAATELVAQGKFDEVNIPPTPSKGKYDEVSILCNAFKKMVNDLKEKEKVQGVLNKVVSQEIAQEILKGNIHLGGEEKRVTMLFADIRNFTKITQSMAPKEIIELLNTCMTKISFVIDQHGGVIDKYVGDATMALFGAPVSRPESALQAIKSALAMVEEIRHWDQERIQQGKTPIEMGIGVHTGNVLAGNMGAENRLNYTVIGSHVNLASRLCSTAPGMQVLITTDTLNEPHVREQVDVQELGPITLKGFDQPIDIFRVLGLK